MKGAVMEQYEGTMVIVQRQKHTIARVNTHAWLGETDVSRAGLC